MQSAAGGRRPAARAEAQARGTLRGTHRRRAPAQIFAIARGMLRCKEDAEEVGALAASLAGEALGPEQVLTQFQSGSAVHRALQSLSAQRLVLLGLAFFRAGFCGGLRRKRRRGRSPCVPPI